MSTITMSDVLRGAREDLAEQWTEYRHEIDRDETRIIEEIAYGRVPVCMYEVMALAAENNRLATADSELGPAFDGRPTTVDIVAANIYEFILADLWEYLRELQEA